MKKLFFAFFILLLITSELQAKPCPEEEQLLKEKKLDLDTKTMKSWVRLLNNRAKQNEYGIILSKEETLALIRCLTIEIEYRKQLGKMK